MDIRWTGCEHTLVGTLPCGMAITLEQATDGVYIEMGNDPVMDIFPDMDSAKEHAETLALPFVRHINPAEMINARLEGYML